jgi:hypothetical protein
MDKLTTNCDGLQILVNRDGDEYRIDIGIQYDGSEPTAYSEMPERYCLVSDVSGSLEGMDATPDNLLRQLAAALGYTLKKQA